MKRAKMYNSSKPGRLFVGYEDERREISQSLQNGRSLAIIGGRRCGKSSLLLRLREDLSPNEDSPTILLPRYISIQGLDRPTPSILFESIYEAITEGFDAPPYMAGDSGREYQTFGSHLGSAFVEINRRYGSRWSIVLLIDELDSALPFLGDDQVFQNLRHLLMDSPYQGNLRMVAAGAQDMTRLVSSGSPLNNLVNYYLSALKGRAARQLISYGFPDVDLDIENYIFQLTGKHPYIMQAILERCTSDPGGLSKRKIDRAAASFLRQQPVFQYWTARFSTAVHCVCRRFLGSPHQPLRLQDLRQSVKYAVVPEVDDAILYLSFHGLVDDTEEERLESICSLFWEWYRARHSTSQRELLEPKIRQSLDGRSQVVPPIHIEITQTATAASRGSVGESTKGPGSAEESERKTLKKSAEETASTIKSAASVAESATSLVDRVRKLFELFLGAVGLSSC